MISRPLLLFCLCSLIAGGAAAQQTDPLKAAVAEPKSGTPADARAAPKAEIRLEAKAGDRCEVAVSETIRRMRGREAQEVQFVAARRQLLPATDDETGVKGEGRYRAASGGESVPFSYSCAYNSSTEATSGVMFRETGVRSAAAAARPFEPDLTFVSPEACESAAAAALKAKHPRIGRLTFGSDSRRMQPGVNGQVQLSGQGALQRAAGMNAVPFSYRCQVDPRSGRVAGIETSD